MEAIFEALLQFVFEFVSEIIAEAVGSVIEGIISFEFGEFLTRHTPVSLHSGEVITLDIQNYKGGNS